MNWGKSLVLVMTLFVLFIAGLGFFLSRNSDSLYEEDYYERGEKHTIAMEQEEMGREVRLSYKGGHVYLELPEPGRINSISFKNMADASLDGFIRYPNSKKQLIFDLEVDSLVSGRWHIKVLGDFDKKVFLKKVQIFLE
jgi:FixH